jgi:hypothetical protein
LQGGLAVVIRISVESRRVGLDAAREWRADVAGTDQRAAQTPKMPPAS